MIVIATLVVREALRRRLVLAVIVLTVLAIALTSWGISRLPTLGRNPPTPDQLRLVVSQIVILIAFMFSFVLALSAVFVAAPSISGEIESGVALAVIARPVSRLSYVIGKWLGLALLLLAYTAGAILLEFVAVYLVADYAAPNPLQALAYLYAEGLVLMTLGLALSTRLSGMVGGVVALVLFGMAWMGGIVGGVGQAFDNPTVMHIGTVTRLLLPTDGLWRGAVYALEPAAILQLTRNVPGPAIAANPFFASSEPPLVFLVWVAAWLSAALFAAVWSFRSREV